MNKKLSKTKASQKCFAVKSKSMSREMQEKLKVAGEKANEKIKRNNEVYKTSNSHAHMHPVGGKQ